MDLNAEDINDLYEEKELLVEDQDVRLLRAMVCDEAVIREFSNTYDEKLFIGDAKGFASLALNYYKSYSSIPTKRTMLEATQGSPDAQEAIEFIWDKINSVPYNASEFRWDLDKIKDRFTKHTFVDIKQGIENLDLSSANYEAALNDIRSRLDTTEKVRKGKESIYLQKTLKEYMPEFREDFVRKTKNPGLGKGLITGYSYLDYITNGLQPTDMLIVGGETGGGKSFLLNNMAIQMWLQGTELGDPAQMKGANIQYFSLEMPYDQCVRRTMSRLAGVSTYALRDCQITDKEQLKSLSKAAKFINSFGYEFDIVDIPRGTTIKSIEDRYLEAVARGRAPQVLVIDYLGLMEFEGASNADDWLRLGHIAGQLHEFARRYGLIILTAVQLNRPKGKEPHEIIGLHRIGRSSLIMTHASIGIQIETRVDEETYSDMPYHVIKNRNGERGNHLLKKDFRKGTVIDSAIYQPLSDDSNLIVKPSMEDISTYLDEFGWN